MKWEVVLVELNKDAWFWYIVLDGERFGKSVNILGFDDAMAEADTMAVKLGTAISVQSRG